MSNNNPGALLAFLNHCLGDGDWTGTVGSWATLPPIEHLGWEQVPVPYALVTPAGGVIELTFTPPGPMTFDVLAVLAHTAADTLAYQPGLPAGAKVKFIDDSTELAEVEWQPVSGRDLPANVYAVLSAPVTIDELTVRIEDAGSDPVRLGGIWASPSIRFRADRGRPVAVEDFSLMGRADATRWPNRRAITRASDVQASLVEQSQAEAFEGVFEQVGTSRPVIYIHRISTAEDRAKTALYGYLEAPAVNHRAGGLYQVQFGVDEVR